MPEIVIGIIIALLVYEFSGFSPGGIITSGYMVFYIKYWEFLAATLAASLIAYFIVRFLSNYMVLYGKRQFSIHMLTGLMAGLFLPQIAGAALDTGMYTIGFLIPGLISSDASKQGWFPTLGALLLSVALTSLVCGLVRGLLW